MRRFCFILMISLIFSCADNQETQIAVEVSCGQCQFGLTSQKGCDLAIRFEDQAYFVDGVHIDDFGDAHDKNTGFCEVIRAGKATGFIKENRFQTSKIELTDKK